MGAYFEVPVTVARSISEHFNKSMVVILSYDSENEMTHTTTFGVTAFDKENAAAAGEKCTAAIGADLSKKQVFEDFHEDYDPAFCKEAIDLLSVISRRQGVTGPQLQQIEKLLKARGMGVRQA